MAENARVEQILKILKNSKVEEKISELKKPQKSSKIDKCDGCLTSTSEDTISCSVCKSKYHVSIECLPANFQLNAEGDLICPWHYQPIIKRDRKKLTCIECKTSENILQNRIRKCQKCPRNFHRLCIEGEYCGVCSNEIVIAINSIVWCQIGNQRDWPGIVVSDSSVPADILKKKNDSRLLNILHLGEINQFTFECYNSLFNLLPKDVEIKPKVYKKRKNDINYEFAVNLTQKLLMEIPKIMASFRPSNLIYKKIQINKMISGVKLPKEREMIPEICECNKTNPCNENSNCSNRNNETECGKVCGGGDLCQNKSVTNRDFKKLEIFDTSTHGYGLRTKERINKGDRIVEYTGELIDENEKLERERRESKWWIAKLEYGLQYNKVTDKKSKQPLLFLDARYAGSEARFASHACHSNCEVLPVYVNGILHKVLVAKHDIEQNDELTINYNWKSNIKCECKSQMCKGFI